MWVLIYILAGIPHEITFTSHGACTAAESMVESKFEVEARCVSRLDINTKENFKWKMTEKNSG